MPRKHVEEHGKCYCGIKKKVFTLPQKVNDKHNLLTSSTRTPKFIREQWCNALMAFH